MARDEERPATPELQQPATVVELLLEGAACLLVAPNPLGQQLLGITAMGETPKGDAAAHELRERETGF